MSDDDLKSSGAEVLGIDEMATFNAYLGALQTNLDKNREKTRAEHAQAADAAKYELRETLYMRVLRKTIAGEVSYHGECIAGLPNANISVQLSMPALDELLAEAKFVYACGLLSSKTECDMLTAHRRAARCSVELADLVDA
jgi:hypothetical protein